MQERIVKYTYEIIGSSEINHLARQFKNSQFLVLTNRLAGLILSGAILLIYSQTRKKPRVFNLCDSNRKLVVYKSWPPLFVCSYSSLSNVLSSWFQYESLKYVTFASQLLAKSSKSLFVMISGKVVSNKSYKRHEYFCVGLIGVGIYLFSDINTSAKELVAKKGPIENSILYTSLPGVLCLLGYLISDSFTSTWQENLVKTHSISSMSLMFISNVYSCIFTAVSLFLEGELSETAQFLNEHSNITEHIVLLSVTSAIGQIFIFVTIQKFGALVFSLIMTTRQVLSIVLSTLVFQHSMSVQGALGAGLIFLALFLQQYEKMRTSGKYSKPLMEASSNLKSSEMGAKKDNDLINL
jgi:adenosine 3'-phospho 5'-phosphosulfate transporter B2